MLAYERIGSGPPLVLLHGVGHRRQAWYPVVDELAAHREVILVDLPGHGESDPFEPAGRGVVDALRDELVAFLDEQNIDRPHMAGNSLGGRIALEAGTIGLAASVTALSPAGFWRSAAAFAYTRTLFRTVEALGKRLAPQAPRLARSKSGRALMFGWITSHPANIDPDRALGDFLAFNRAIPALRAIVRGAAPFTDQVKADVPVTVAWGSRDLVLPPYQAKVARSALPQASHVTLVGCGHVPMSDDPKRVAEVLLRGSRN
ncbi:MAG TPA: alpha/beta fold hydrolase [Pseudonocardiaceae bacterium]|jgi:pimeloyl-ACP methyl ester carboxylesterase